MRTPRSSLYKEVFCYFTRMGAVGFGGPFAMIAYYQNDLVEKRHWCSLERFNQSLALIKAMPGPISTQMAIHLGCVRAGTLGGVLAGVGSVLPAFLLILLFGAFYDQLAHVHGVSAFLAGTQYAALALIFDSVLRLARPYVTVGGRSERALFLVLAGVAAAIVVASPTFEPLVIVGFGLIGAYRRELSKAWRGKSLSIAPLPLLFWVCFKAGAFVFGTGLAIIPLLAHDVVDKYHWISSEEFLNALALGQVTPGPISVTATFIGYKTASFAGAAVATVGVFLMSFFNILTWFGWAERKLAGSPRMPRFVFFAVAAVVGSILVAFARLSYAALAPLDAREAAMRFLLFAATFLTSRNTKAPSWMLVLVAGMLGAFIF